MRFRLAQFATGSTMVVMLALSPALLAQQQNPTARDRVGNPTAGGNTNQASAQTETIKGVIAGITAEGEAMFDYRSNRAVAAEATYLTVVGSPEKWNGNEATRPATADASRRETGTTNRESGGRNRHNVYYVWLTPKTKVCEDWSEHGKTAATSETQTSTEKKEVAIDNLEIGDHVQIQFVRREESAANQTAHQTDQMARKHGRHRTFVGQANSVTIMASHDTSANKSDVNDRSNKSDANDRSNKLDTTDRSRRENPK